jgi:hypothetical protein
MVQNPSVFQVARGSPVLESNEEDIKNSTAAPGRPVCFASVTFFGSLHDLLAC